MVRLKTENIIETYNSGAYQLDLLSTGFSSLKRRQIEILRFPELANQKCEICLAPNRQTLTCGQHTPFIRHGLPETPKKVVGLGYYYYRRRLSLANVLTRIIMDAKKDPTRNEVLELLGIALGFFVKNKRIECDSLTFVPSFRSRSILNHLVSSSLSTYLDLPLRTPEEWLLDKITEVGVIDLPLNKRRDFVTNLFEAKMEEQIFEGEKVLLFDDILASGETLSRNAFILRELGAKTITGAVLARSISKPPRKMIRPHWLNLKWTKSQKSKE